MLDIPPIPSSNHPSVTTEVGRFRVICQRGDRPANGGRKVVHIRLFEFTDDRRSLYEHDRHLNKPAWPLRVPRFYYKTVMHQLLPLLLLDALPDRWQPTLKRQPERNVPSRNPNRRR